MLKFVSKTEIFLQFELPMEKNVLKVAKCLEVLEFYQKIYHYHDQNSDEKSDKNSDEEVNDEYKRCAPSEIFSKKIHRSKKTRNLDLDLSLESINA